MPRISTLKQAIEVAMSIERLGATFYKTLAELFERDEEIASVFTKLGEDEEFHEHQFGALLVAVPPELAASEERETSLFLWSMSPADLFSDDSSLGGDTDQIKTRDDALERALGLEKETLSFYLALKEEIGGHEILDTIIDMEKKHIVSLMRYIVTGAKMRGLGDGFTGSDQV
jgi:rubrerythrin